MVCTGYSECLLRRRAGECIRVLWQFWYELVVLFCIATYLLYIEVLPLEEDNGQEVKDDLFTMDEIRIEVMRARGAGGQVRNVHPTSKHGIDPFSAR